MSIPGGRIQKETCGKKKKRIRKTKRMFVTEKVAWVIRIPATKGMGMEKK